MMVILSPFSNQNAYIATVSLPNGHKYEGSNCKTKQEAAKSAASMALLCLVSRELWSGLVISWVKMNPWNSYAFH